MIEVQPLLETFGCRNWRSIMLTHDEFSWRCLLQTWWHPARSNLVLFRDAGELLSMGLPDSSQRITIIVVGVMMAIKWLEAHVGEKNRQKAPTKEQLEELNCRKDLDLSETTCKVLNIPMEVKKIWARRRLMAWFRAIMTAGLYECAKKHISKHSSVYSSFQLDIGPQAFKQAFVTHWSAVTTAVKRTVRTIDLEGGGREDMLREDLERNVMNVIASVGTKRHRWIPSPVASKGWRSKGVGGTPPKLLDWQLMCWWIQKPKMWSQSRKERR